MYQDLPRCTPEQAGIPSGVILKWLDALEATGTEPHGFMIARHGKVCAEGWWAPYAPRFVHGLQSLTKTYTVTALGLLHDEGKLDLNEKIVDVLARYVPKEHAPELDKATVRDVLRMSTGVKPRFDISEPDWLTHYFSLPGEFDPGSFYFYSGTTTAVGGAIIRERTGENLIPYMTPRLFDKIGIDARRLRTYYTGDGLEYGGGGFFTTTEDNLRLMMLYLNKGMWNGQRVLSEEWCREVSTKQIETATEAINNPGVDDNYFGYGLQCWMCRPEGVYRADGAMGQFSIVVPHLDMVISINEAGDQSKLQHQHALETVWDVLLPGIAQEALPESEDAAVLRSRLLRLALPHTVYSLRENSTKQLGGIIWHMEDNQLLMLPGITFLRQGKEKAGIRSIHLDFSDPQEAILSWQQGDTNMRARIGTAGQYAVNRGDWGPIHLEWLYAIGGWIDSNTFEAEFKMVETCFSVKAQFRVDDGVTLTLIPHLAMPGSPDQPLTLHSVS